MNKRKSLLAGFIAGILLLGNGLSAKAQELKYDSPGTGNPIIPGYFADPTVVKFGDTYYVYATTDGNGGGLGPSQVWTSKDFVNWTLMPMNWPTTHWIWAPDVMKRGDLYYLYYCQPCQIYCGVSETPRGPWKNLLGFPEAVLVPDRLEPMAITLDGQTFVDEDGSVYLYWGTWGIYPKHGCGVGKFNPDLKSFEKVSLIPNTQAKDFFEAPYVIKKDGIYYFTYSAGSCHDHTYRVQYATSKTGPMGPFEFPENNPILETNADGSIHGPGHHSILEVNGEYYIVYHRHNNPQSTRGMHRQIAVDKLVFTGDGRIEKVKPTHEGVGFLGENTNPFPNLAYGKTVRASSVYNDNFKAEYAVDDNNGTIWRPSKGFGEEWLEIDLGKVETVRRVQTQFEYATSYYQYKIEVSKDGNTWQLFSDKTGNTLAGSPMTDYGDAEARYVRITLTGNEEQGQISAIWNIKVFSGAKMDPPQILVHLEAENLGDRFDSWKNQDGMLGGFFKAEGQPQLKVIEGKAGLVLPAGTFLTSSFRMPEGFYTGQPWTVSYTVFGTSVEVLKGIMSWQPGTKNKLKIKQPDDTRTWHNVVRVSDGKTERVYLDGKEVAQSKSLRKGESSHLKIGTADQEFVLANLRIYNRVLEPAEVRYDAEMKYNRPREAAAAPQGLLLHIDAQDYNAGMALSKVANKGGMKGEMVVTEGSLPVRLKQNRMAFEFDGTKGLRSSFRLPRTISGVGNYTIAAWVLNPEVEENECIADLNSGEGELNKVVLGYGKNAASGVACHYGGYEDIALQKMPEAGQWHHMVLTNDGYAETVYVDGKQMAHKDMVLRLTPEGRICIGQRSDGQWGFSGYLSEVKIYDYALKSGEVKQLAAEASGNRILLGLNAGECDYGKLSAWMNEGQWGGSMRGKCMVTDVAGKLALVAEDIEGCRIDGLKRDESRGERSILLDYRVPSYAATLFELGEEYPFAVQAVPGGLRIQTGTNKQQVELKKQQAGEWCELVLVNAGNDLKVYLNGVYVTTVTGCAIPGAVSGIELLKNACRKSVGSINPAIADFLILSGTWGDAEIAQYAEVFRKNDVATLNAEVKAQALTPNIVCVGITVDENLRNELKYYFENVTSAKVRKNSGWINVPEYLEGGCQPDRVYSYLVKVKDGHGNVRTLEKSLQVKTATVGFETVIDNFTRDHDYVQAGIASSVWKNLDGEKPEECIVKAVDGKLRIQSKDRQIQREAATAPFLNVEVDGDFVAQVKVADVIGLAQKKGCGYNEAGILVMDADSRPGNISEIHLSLFPMYPDKGNMWTSMGRHGRPQVGNATGWQPDPYLQVERRGEFIYLRTSRDGINWKDMPETPVRRSDFGKRVKVGLFQCTYTGETGYGDFEEFRLWKVK